MTHIEEQRHDAPTGAHLTEVARQSPAEQTWHLIRGHHQTVAQLRAAAGSPAAQHAALHQEDTTP